MMDRWLVGTTHIQGIYVPHTLFRQLLTRLIAKWYFPDLVHCLWCSTVTLLVVGRLVLGFILSNECITLICGLVQLQCYCYVCEKPAPCKRWTIGTANPFLGHCDANIDFSLWSKVKELEADTSRLRH